jgi:hypothetical protein
MHFPGVNKISKAKSPQLLIPVLRRQGLLAARFECAASAVNKVTASYYFSPYGCNLSVFGDSACVGGSESGNQTLLDRIFMKEIVCDSFNSLPPSRDEPCCFFVYGNAGACWPGDTCFSNLRSPALFLTGSGDPLAELAMPLRTELQPAPGSCSTPPAPASRRCPDLLGARLCTAGPASCE